jgi:hypothetical protein
MSSGRNGYRHVGSQSSGRSLDGTVGLVAVTELDSIETSYRHCAVE